MFNVRHILSAGERNLSACVLWFLAIQEFTFAVSRDILIPLFCLPRVLKPTNFKATFYVHIRIMFRGEHFENI